MSLSRGEALVDMFRRQDPFDHRLDWLAQTAGWRVSASVYAELYAIAADFDPDQKESSPMVMWKIIRDPLMPDGHAAPFDKDGNVLTIWGWGHRTTSDPTSEGP